MTDNSAHMFIHNKIAELVENIDTILRQIEKKDILQVISLALQSCAGLEREDSIYWSILNNMFDLLTNLGL